ncbi:sorbosone dehydrogenase family protein [Paeniglutamicibacter sp. Y32M11]|uniref:PQQ-dependent sugar dehydrogenase n=1 Tax=Paeniglutamicibacter sp. Y32M11 TaxID=2853258 RepID=UPI001C5323F8|nr:PQQ-dependent sugar dehydrogenase [Paeniglutamicibacter sp. Y32M11]QXQ12284.1 PQQ-dependent sugar dehydrogenase [Paeniglutamicibacter sp. Y32M11]
MLAAGAGISFLLTSCLPTPPLQPSPSPSSSAETSTPPSSPSTSASASGSAGAAAPTDTPRVVSSGLEAPWSVVFRESTALVSERDSGRILELAEDGSSRVIGTVPGVAGSGEGGLLGLTVDDQGRLYVYSTGAGENRIQRFDVTGTPGSLALGSPVTILDGIPSASYHDGGRLAFGPDGMLYATVGDAGQAGQAQDLDSLSGKILRMTADGDIPHDNPFDGSVVYSYGHRNPQGLAWAQDGTMFATEFGQNTWDELNIITAGANYGWPTVEGIEDTEGFTNPVQQWTPEVASPSGMTYADGTLFIANLRGTVLRAVPVADPTTFTDHYAGEYGRLRDVTLSPNGELWFLTNNTDGRGTPGPEDDRILGVDLE